MELVRIDSVSGEEKEIADFLVEKLEDLGLEVFKQVCWFVIPSI